LARAGELRTPETNVAVRRRAGIGWSSLAENEGHDPTAARVGAWSTAMAKHLLVVTPRLFKRVSQNREQPELLIFIDGPGHPYCGRGGPTPVPVEWAERIAQRVPQGIRLPPVPAKGVGGRLK
jgi:hypothetical protein